MNASWLDLRRRMKAILRALDRNEPVRISYRGKLRAVMHPVTDKGSDGPKRLSDHPAVGMWAVRADLEDVAQHMRRIRQGRFDAL